MPRADWQSPSPNVMPSSPDPHMSCSQALAWLGCVPKPQPGQVPQRHAMICSDTHLAFEAAVEPAAASVIVDNRSRS
jgi:hypothetical protein